ncbi:aldehyde dehydrogenase [Hymenopellis radicata]|nr:aldehyde dehydrogenase [Hymenopellis radicata]
MSHFAYTPLDALPKIYNTLRTTFKSRVTRPIPWRQHQLLQVARMVQDNQKLFVKAIHNDLGRPELETCTFEIMPVIERSLISATCLPEWVKPDVKKDLFDSHHAAWNPKVYSAPKGVALAIAPWNFPMILSLQPLIAAISAGCCCVVKVSEFAPHYGGLLSELFPKYMDQSAYQVVFGAVPEVTSLLEMKWDHIFYTGNGKVGRVISAAAAKHLTPITLELGGKSPVILDPSYDIEVAARRVLFGKCVNAGQICVCPDYLIVPTGGNPEILTRVVEAFKAAHKTFYPDGAPLQSESFSHIVSRSHYARLCDLLTRTKGKIVFGGGKDAEILKIEPTVLTGISADDALMEGEIFGPVLPIMEVDTLEDACDFIESRDHPLVLYAFTENEDVKTMIRENTTSGNLVYNDTFIQLAVHELPFGGVGESGHGRQITRYGFETFSYMRASIDMPLANEPFLTPRYPPYTQEQINILNPGLSNKIPDSTPTLGLAT